MTATNAIYQAIAKVMATLAREGISKGRENKQQGYKFRGIDDVYNALAPALCDAGLIVIPKCISRELIERESKSGGALFYVTVQASYLMIAVSDGSSVEAGPFYGEAMDSGDKATNKAMSAAYKYWAMQTFAIPTEGDNDADATTHEVAAPKMEPNALADWCASIDSQASLANLQKTFTEAVVQARNMHDKDAEKAMISAKDARKVALNEMRSA